MSEEVDYSRMDDDEFMNQPLPEDEPEDTQEQVDTPIEQEEEQPEQEEVSNEQEPEPEEDVSGDESQDTGDDTTEEEPSETVDDEPSEEDKEVDSKDAESVPEIDYKAEYNRLVAPFKASHKQVQVANVDDALNLMKQGVDYTKKMQGLKPNMRLMKMLQNNDLLDEDKINYMIDLSKHNPEAVQKFIKEGKIDPLDIDTEKEVDYQPSNYQVSDKEVELDAVLDNIRDTPAFQDTIDVITKQLDSSSKDVLSKTPKLIETINEHMESGVYQQVMSVVENERMLGRLTGMNDLQAYKHVGDVIQANGGFNQQQTPPQQQPIAQPNNAEVKHQEQQRTQKRKAASPTRSTKPTSSNNNFDPMKMSDEDFMKATNDMFDNYG